VPRRKNNWSGFTPPLLVLGSLLAVTRSERNGIASYIAWVLWRSISGEGKGPGRVVRFKEAEKALDDVDRSIWDTSDRFYRLNAIQYFLSWEFRLPIVTGDSIVLGLIILSLPEHVAFPSVEVGSLAIAYLFSVLYNICFVLRLLWLSTDSVKTCTRINRIRARFQQERRSAVSR